jgi:sugar phosphate isomerase/epimerase
LAQITACSTLGFCHFSIDVAARQIAQMGFKKIEIAHMGTRCRHYSLGEEDPHRIGQLFSDLGLTPIATNYSTGWIKEGERVEDLGIRAHAEIIEPRVQRLLRELSILRVPLVTIPVGRRTESAERAQRVREAARVISRLGDFAADLGIRLALEVPHCWDLHNNLERVDEIFGLITSANVGALIDSSHWTLLQYELEDWYGIVGDRLWHVHLRDAGARVTSDFKLTVPLPQELEKTAGRGDCDFSALAAWLDTHRYQGEVSIEFEYRDPQMDLSDIRAEYDFGMDFLSRNGWTVPASVVAQRSKD